MDAILRGTLSSQHPVAVKTALIVKVRHAVELDMLSTEQMSQLISICSTYLLYPPSSDLIDPIRDLFLITCNKCPLGVTCMLTPDFITAALCSSKVLSTSVPLVLGAAISAFQKDANLYEQISNAVSCNLLTFITLHHTQSIPAIDRLLTLCLQNPHFLPRTSAESSCDLTKILLRFLANLQLSSFKENAAGFVSIVETVADVVEALWRVSSANSLRRTIALFFSFVADDSNPSEAYLPLAAVMKHIRLEYLSQCVTELVDIYESDQNAVKLILYRLTNFLRWPRSTHLDSWVIMFILGLKERGRAVLVLEYIRDNVVNVIRLLPMRGIARQSVTTLLEFMLYTYQHTHELVELVAKELPEVCRLLHLEDTPSAHCCLVTLAEMGHTLTYMHKIDIRTMPQPVVGLLKEFPAPPKDLMAKRIKAHKWTNMARIQPVDFTKSLQVKRRSETGCVGLLNVGNTCYANAALQLLYNCPDFRKAVLNKSASIIRRSLLCSQLHSVFASLENSKASVSDPASFIQVTRPPHFVPGEQQDAAEYLGHLLDRLHEEERAIVQPSSDAPAASCEPPSDTPAASCEPPISQVSISDISPCLPHSDDVTPMEVCENESSRAAIDVESGPKTSTTLVQSLFSGSMQRLSSCKACKHESMCKENFYFIFLPLSPTNGQTGPKDFDKSKCNESPVEDIGRLVREHLASVEEIPDTGICDNCGQQEGTRRSLTLNRLPPYVFLCLNLFTFNRATQSCTKLNRRFRVPEFLPVVPISSTNAHSAPPTGLMTDDCGPSPPSKPDHQSGYSLVGMIVHHGVSMTFGHYTTVSRVGVNWVWFDDDTARYTQLEQVGAEASCTPYLLLYSRNS